MKAALICFNAVFSAWCFVASMLAYFVGDVPSGSALFVLAVACLVYAYTSLTGVRVRRGS